MEISTGELLSIFINLAVGIYFAVYYPRSIHKRFTSHTMPRAFITLVKVVPMVGYLIIGLTMIYTIAMLSGMAPKS
jgi:hypothetical protein